METVKQKKKGNEFKHSQNEVNKLRKDSYPEKSLLHSEREVVRLFSIFNTRKHIFISTKYLVYKIFLCFVHGKFVIMHLSPLKSTLLLF